MVRENENVTTTFIVEDESSEMAAHHSDAKMTKHIPIATGFSESTIGRYMFGMFSSNSTLGHCTQQDSWGGSLSDPSTGNCYAYANDDLTNLTDPSGK